MLGAGIGAGIDAMIPDEHFTEPAIVEPRGGRGVVQAVALEAKDGGGPAIGEPLAGQPSDPIDNGRPAVVANASWEGAA